MSILITPVAFRPPIRHNAPVTVYTSRCDRTYVTLRPFIRIACVFAGLVASAAANEACNMEVPVLHLQNNFRTGSDLASE